MARLHIHVEGPTEETFVNEVLSHHLIGRGYHAVTARIVGNARQRDRRGGIIPWPAAKADIVRHLSSDPTCIATTMVDYYGLPSDDAKGWPGRAAAAALRPNQKAPAVQGALMADVSRAMNWPAGINPPRFVPFVLMHEFEGLLFSDCQAFANAIGRPTLSVQFQAIRDQFPTPEEINDSPLTAPSKRVEGLVPGYQKPLSGSIAILEIGLPTIRAACPNFNAWLTELESLA